MRLISKYIIAEKKELIKKIRSRDSKNSGHLFFNDMKDFNCMYA